MTLEKMNWKKTHDDNFLPKGTSQLDLGAQVVCDKIYISQPTLNEFFIYDLGKKGELKEITLIP